MKQVLVTGANGQLGLAIKAATAAYPELSFVFTGKSDLDVTSPRQIEAFFNTNTIDVCINAAAYTHVDKAEDEPEAAYLLNETAPRLLAEACKKHGVFLIHISTDYVFDGTKGSPYTAEDRPNPINVYGASKLAGEKAIANVGGDHCIVRTSWLYSEFGNNFVKTMLRLAETRKQISVVNDQIGSPTYAGDLAEFILKIISSESKAYELYHYSNVGEISWYDFAVEIFRQHNKDVHVIPVPTGGLPTTASRPVYSVISQSLIKKNLNIEAPIWSESLKNIKNEL